jgi:hypothetical protein
MRRLLRASVVGAVALVALLGASAAADTTPMTTTKVQSAGVSLTYPSGWTVVPVSKKGLDAMRTAAAKNNPKLAALLSSGDPSQFKFYSIDGTGARGVSSNVNVLVASGAQGITVADLRDQLGQVYKAAGATLRDVKAVRVGNRKAFRSDAALPFKSSDGSITAEANGQLVIPGPTSTAVVTVTSTDDATGVALINDILASVRPR